MAANAPWHNPLFYKPATQNQNQNKPPLDLSYIKQLVAKSDEKGNNKQKIEEAFIQCCCQGKEDCVNFLLTRGINIDATDSDGTTGLMGAFEFGHEIIVEILIKHRANLNKGNKDGETPLGFAAAHGFEKMVELLLEYGADIEYKDGSGATPLMTACRCGHASVVESLLKRNANINANHNHWKTPLMYAIQAHNNDIVSLLLQNGVDVNKTAMTLAIGNIEVIEMLLRHGGKFVFDDTFVRENLMELCPDEVFDLFVLLAKYGCFKAKESKEDIGNAFMYIARTGLPKTVELMFQNGLDANHLYECMEKMTPLMYIVRFKAHPETEKILVKYSNVNTRDNDGETALIKASRFGKFWLVWLLLHNDANMDAQDRKGMTAIMNAANYNRVPNFRLLLRSGANLDLRDRDGQTVFSHALKCYTIHRVANLVTLLGDQRFMDGKQLKPIHKNANNSDCGWLGLMTTIVFGVFEWNWRCMDSYYIKVCFCAMKSGWCPGRIRYGSRTESPLISAFLDDDEQAFQTFIKYLYFYPEDYRILVDKSIKAPIGHSDFLHRLTLQPMSLLAWSLLNVSKSISLSGPSSQRRQRVDKLQLPRDLKYKLLFQEETIRFVSETDPMRQPEW